MKQKSCGPRLGKLVHQLPGVVTFAYDLRFRRMIARWKGIVKEIHFRGSIMPLPIFENLDFKKHSFRPSKWPRKLKLAKNNKLPKLPENCFEPVGKGGWPPISTWINPPSLGSNGIHCVEFLGEREKHLMDLHLGELLVLVETSRCLVCGSLSMKLLKLRLFNKSSYMRERCAEGIFVLYCNLVDLLLLDRRCRGRGCSGCSVLLFPF
jgi:hypothetical protein